jgi:hypothetical protein
LPHSPAPTITLLVWCSCAMHDWGALNYGFDSLAQILMYEVVT